MKTRYFKFDLIVKNRKISTLHFKNSIMLYKAKGFTLVELIVVITIV
ncbi:MAG: type II secretion system protein [Flavobacteriaceae bacterium]|nr:type II secretion system protein [Flavobacteriaceae bacterium]